MNDSTIEFGNQHEETKHESTSETDQSCPECEGQIIHDEDHGETACKECGLVIDNKTVDHSPEWRAFNAEEEDEKSRVGAPMTPLMHDRGLSTTIGWQNKDAYGRSISARKRARLNRLRTWDERLRTKNPHERNLKHAFGEITRMGSALGFAEPVQETAGVVYRRAVEENLLPGRSIEAMTTASLYGAARQQGTPRTLDEFATVSRVEKLSIQRAYRYLSKELNLGIAPADPAEYIPQFASQLEAGDEAERLACELLDVAEEQNVYSGKNPAGLAAAALYAAAYLTNENLTQEEVSDTTHISRVTIRNRYQELLEKYKEHSETIGVA
jgi:transcription initiation factor TFIIB